MALRDHGGDLSAGRQHEWPVQNIEVQDDRVLKYVSNKNRPGGTVLKQQGENH